MRVKQEQSPDHVPGRCPPASSAQRAATRLPESHDEFQQYIFLAVCGAFGIVETQFAAYRKRWANEMMTVPFGKVYLREGMGLKRLIKSVVHEKEKDRAGKHQMVRQHSRNFGSGPEGGEDDGEGDVLASRPRVEQSVVKFEDHVQKVEKQRNSLQPRDTVPGEITRVTALQQSPSRTQRERTPRAPSPSAEQHSMSRKPSQKRVRDHESGSEEGELVTKRPRVENGNNRLARLSVNVRRKRDSYRPRQDNHAPRWQLPQSRIR